MEAHTEIDLDWQLDLQGYAQTSYSTKQNTDKAKNTPKTWRKKERKKSAKLKSRRVDCYSTFSMPYLKTVSCKNL